ncbi:DNA-binding protein [Aquincola sp. J276]|uniref:DNA-binding protein n=1 Tax=Aquincola sp. J276 TaxID=2898432 RepID=UPI0021511B7C|nr:DNA-binding protein [Aquincola sp. J276]MCR5868123.1 DNA-binding protein [Aquincola sp. J276]
MSMEPTITDELVWKAVRHLAAQGLTPTNGSVRALLADWTCTKGGSFSTIAPVLRAWKARRLVSTMTADSDRLPKHMQERGRELLADFWNAARTSAAATLTNQRDELHLNETDSLSRHAHIDRVVAELNAKLEAAEKRSAAAEQRIDELFHTVHMLEDLMNRAEQSSTGSAIASARDSLGRKAVRSDLSNGSQH